MSNQNKEWDMKRLKHFEKDSYLSLKVLVSFLWEREKMFEEEIKYGEYFPLRNVTVWDRSSVKNLKGIQEISDC